MANLNKVMLMGNLTRDVELRAISSGQSVAKIGLAINRRWKTPQGEEREEVTYVDCEAWGKTAEVMAKYLAKGRPVFIEGRLKLDQWQDKESGQNRSKMAVVVETFQFIDSTRGGGGGGGGGGASASGGGGDGGESGWSKPASPAGRAPARSAPQPVQEVPADDIPF